MCISYSIYTEVWGGMPSTLVVHFISYVNIYCFEVEDDCLHAGVYLHSWRGTALTRRRQHALMQLRHRIPQSVVAIKKSGLPFWYLTFRPCWLDKFWQALAYPGGIARQPSFIYS